VLNTQSIAICSNSKRSQILNQNTILHTHKDELDSVALASTEKTQRGVRRRLFFGNGRTEVGGRRCVGIRRRQVAQIRRSESTELGRDLGCSSLQICLSAVELDSGQEVMEMRNGGRNEEWGNELAFSFWVYFEIQISEMNVNLSGIEAKKRD